MPSPAENPLAGEDRSRIWDRTLVLLSARGQVEPESVRDLLRREVTSDEVRVVFEALVERGWLERPDPAVDVWLPGERARRLLDLPTLGPGATGSDRHRSPVGATTESEAVALALV